MSSAAQTLVEALRLLESLPGLAAVSGRIDGGRAIIEVASSGARSAHLVLDLCQAANVELEPPLLLRDPSYNAEIHRQFTLLASTAGDEVIQYGNLQLLGIHLVWHLHKAGAMSEMAANQLLQEWNGARVGA